MSFRPRRFHKPDPILLLAFVVGIAVIVTVL